VSSDGTGPLKGRAWERLGRDEEMSDFWQDVRYSVRTLVRSPLFALVAVVTLALGVGGNTAIFSVVEDVLLRPLPYKDPDQLVVVGGDLPGIGVQDLTASPAEYRDYRDRAATLVDLAVSWPNNSNLTGSLEPQRVAIIAVTANYLSVLGRTPALGRDFKPEDALGEIGYVAILSWDAWHGLFNGDPDVVGKTVKLDDDPYTIIGVMPEDFEEPGESGVDRASIWIVVDLRAGNRYDQRRIRTLTLIGRLKPNASLEASRAEFASIAEALRHEYPKDYPEGSGWTITVSPLRERMLGDVRPTLMILFAAVTLVLLTACTNVASLLLTRGQGRRRELAVRTAIGGGRGRLIRQLLTETLILVLAGGTTGVIAAALALHLLRGAMVSALPRSGHPSLDWTALCFAFFVSLLAGLLSGLFPALQASRVQPQDMLREGRSGGVGGRRLRSVLATGQVAVSLMLVVGAGLLTRSLIHALRMDTGLDPHGVLAVQTWLPIPNDLSHFRFQSIPSRVGYVERALEEFRGNPAVVDAAMTSLIPLRGLQGRPFLVEGQDRPQGEGLPTAEFRQVSANYFRVMGIPLLQGRSFTDQDVAGSPLVTVVDRRMADQWLGGNPIGKRIAMGPGAPPLEVVGVVGNVREGAVEAQYRPHYYVPYRQLVGLNISFVLKAVVPPETLSGFAREAVRSVDPDEPVFGVAPMETIIAGTLGRERLLTTLLGLFAGVGLLLAAVGVYGVVAYGVRQRTREIGIRLALGASPRGVTSLVLRDGLWIAGVGAAAGLVAAGMASGLLRAVLHGVGDRDPVTFAVATLVAAGVALLATVLPARLAARVHPVESMRQESH
jgi:putative ABC transport system permease protein